MPRYTPPMRIGLVLPLEHASNGPPPWAIAVAERAEAIGLDSVWAYDHFFSTTADAVSGYRITLGREPDTNEGEGGVFVDELPKLFEDYEALGVDDVVLGFETPDERSLDRLERVLRSR